MLSNIIPRNFTSVGKERVSCDKPCSNIVHQEKNPFTWTYTGDPKTPDDLKVISSAERLVSCTNPNCPVRTDQFTELPRICVVFHQNDQINPL